MMQQKYYIHWDKLEYKLNTDTSFTAHDGGIDCYSSGTLQSKYSTSEDTLQTGIKLENRCYKSACDGRVQSEYLLEIPELGIFETYVSGNPSTNSICTIQNLRIYVHPFGKWMLEADGIEWHIGGEKIFEHPEFEHENFQLTPSSVPLIGIPPEIFSSCNSYKDPIFGIQDGEEPYDIQLSSTATGGWRFFKNNSWHTPPINHLPGSSNSATNTYDATVHAEYTNKFHYGSYETENVDRGPDGREAVKPAILEKRSIHKKFYDSEQSITLIPSLPKGINKCGDTYGAIISSRAFPKFCSRSENKAKSRMNPQDIFTVQDIPINNKSDIGHHEVYPYIPQETFVASENAGKEDAIFQFTTYAPTFESNTECEYHDIERTCIEEGIFHMTDGSLNVEDNDSSLLQDRWLEHASKTMIFPYMSKDSADKNGVIPYLHHRDAIPFYNNTVVNPHWSFSYAIDSTDRALPPKLQADGELHGSDSVYYLLSYSLSKSRLSRNYFKNNSSWWGLCKPHTIPIDSNNSKLKVIYEDVDKPTLIFQDGLFLQLSFSDEAEIKRSLELLKEKNLISENIELEKWDSIFIDDTGNICISSLASTLPPLASLPQIENNRLNQQSWDYSQRGTYYAVSGENEAIIESADSTLPVKFDTKPFDAWNIIHLENNLPLREVMLSCDGETIGRVKSYLGGVFQAESAESPLINLYPWHGILTHQLSYAKKTLYHIALQKINKKYSTSWSMQGVKGISLVDGEYLQLFLHYLKTSSNKLCNFYQSVSCNLGKTWSDHKMIFENIHLADLCKLPDGSLFALSAKYLDKNTLEIFSKVKFPNDKSFKETKHSAIAVSSSTEIKNINLSYSESNPHGILLAAISKSGECFSWVSNNLGSTWKEFSLGVNTHVQK